MGVAQGPVGSVRQPAQPAVEGLVQLPRGIVPVPSHRNCRRIRDKRWQDGWQAFHQLGALYCANISSKERHDIALSLGIVRV